MAYSYGAEDPPHDGTWFDLIQGVLGSAEKGSGLRVLRVGEPAGAAMESNGYSSDLPYCHAQACVARLAGLADGA